MNQVVEVVVSPVVFSLPTRECAFSSATLMSQVAPQ